MRGKTRLIIEPWRKAFDIEVRWLERWYPKEYAFVMCSTGRAIILGREINKTSLYDETIEIQEAPDDNTRTASFIFSHKEK